MQAIGENTYESIPSLPIVHKRKKKNRMMKNATDEELNKTAAAMLEDITRKSCHFLASTATTCTAIRLQKIVTSSRCSEKPSLASNYNVNSSSHQTYRPQDHHKSKRKDLTECNGPGRPDTTNNETSCRTQSETSDSCRTDLDNGSLSAQLDEPSKLTHKEMSSAGVPVVPSERPVEGNNIDEIDGAMEYFAQDPVLQNKLSAEKEKNKERMRKLKEVRNSRSEEEPPSLILPDMPSKNLMGVESELVAEKIRNKERMRKREKAKEERKLRMSSETLPSRNGYDSNDGRNSRANSEMKANESSASSHRRRSRLSKKKEAWKRGSHSIETTSTSNESSPSDISTLSADDDERLVSSGTAETLNQQVRNNDSLEKNILELTNGVGGGYAPFPYSIGPEFDRVPPLRPHPPYANSIYGPGPLHGPLFNQPALQIPYGNLRPFQAFAATTTTNNNGALPTRTPSTLERTIPKLNNLVLRETPDLVTSNNNTNNNGSNHNDNLDNSNIILPSGRGKPRETERVINRDVENLEKAQEEARARLKAFLDRAEAEGKLEHVVPNESVT